MAVKPNEVFVLEMNEEQRALCSEIEKSLDGKLRDLKPNELFYPSGRTRPISLTLDEIHERSPEVTGVVMREVCRRYEAQGWKVAPWDQPGERQVIFEAGVKSMTDIEWLTRFFNG